MKLEDALRTRRSERHFSDDPVPRADIEALIAAASHAPSAGNRQPWKVAAFAPAAARRLIDAQEPRAWEILYPTLREVIAGSPEVLGHAPTPRAIADATVGFVRDNIFVRGAPWLLLVYYDRPGLRARAKVVASTLEMMRHRVAAQATLAAKAELAAFMAGAAPTALRTDALADVASVSGFMYGLTLAAHARGLASCIQFTWALVADAVRARLDLPKRAEVLGAVVVGRADCASDKGLQPRVAPRKPVAVTWVGDDGAQVVGRVAPS